MEALWYALLALHADGLRRPRRLRLRRRHRPPRRRAQRRGAPHRPRRHRPGLGRQRGLARRLGRRALLRLPARLRRRLQRLLPAAHDRAVAARPARPLDRVPRRSGTTRCGAPSSTRRSPSRRRCWRFVLGASLGNVVRGVPLDADGAFVAPLFDFGGRPARSTRTPRSSASSPSPRSPRTAPPTWRGRCDGELARAQPPPRAPRAARRRRARSSSSRSRPGACSRRSSPAFAHRAVGLAAAARRRRGARRSPGAPPRASAIAPPSSRSAAFLAALLAATAAALFPVLLRSTVDARYDVTASGAATGHHGLAWGLIWWIPALALAVAYFAYLFRSFAGKVRRVSLLDARQRRRHREHEQDVDDADGDVALVVPAEQRERDLAAQVAHERQRPAAPLQVRPQQRDTR